MSDDQKNNPVSYIMFISSMLIFGTIGIFRRMIPLSSGVLAFSRGVLGTVFLLAYVKLTKRKVFAPVRKKVLLFLVLSGMVMGFNWILLFEAYNYTTVAIATLCYYMQPLIVVLMSVFLFKEHLTKRKALCILVALLGMVLVSGVFENGATGADNTKGIVLGLLAACLYAMVIILNKVAGNAGKVDSYQKTILQLSSAAVVMIPYLFFTEKGDFSGVTPTAVMMLLIVGIVHTGIAYVLYFGSMDGLRISSIALLSYIDPVSALFLSFLILHEKMTVMGIIGAVMVIGAAICCERE